MGTILAEDYLAGRGGSVYEFHYNMSEGQRMGQAFFNALSGTDQERLRGQINDPFYNDGPGTGQKIVNAIQFLLDTESKETQNDNEEATSGQCGC